MKIRVKRIKQQELNTHIFDLSLVFTLKWAMMVYDENNESLET